MMMKHVFRMTAVLFLAVMAMTLGCQKAYYSFWETMGKEKRHLLKEKIESVQTDQQLATEQFQDVLTAIDKLYGFEGGELEVYYDKLKTGYEGAEERAKVVSDRIKQVEMVAEDLFKEWEKEMLGMQNAELKERSRQSLKDTKERYQRMHNSMLRAKNAMTPVLKNLEDHVLYLKHSLNAMAVGTLRTEMLGIETEIRSLIQEINRSILEAEDFLETF